MILLVMLCQTAVYREVTALFSIKNIDGEESPQEKDPWSKTLNWYFFAVTNYYLYGESIIYYFKVRDHQNSISQLTLVRLACRLRRCATHAIRYEPQDHQLHIIHYRICRIRHVVEEGLPSKTIWTLRLGSHELNAHCCLEVGSFLPNPLSDFSLPLSHFIINNILEGLIWLWIPASLVICNDVFAYVWGITLGRTPLIKLSPKKTVEGFVGAFFSTMLFGVIWGTLFMRWQYMICPVTDLGVNAWSGVVCEPNPVFVWREWEIWAPLRVFLAGIVRLYPPAIITSMTELLIP